MITSAVVYLGIIGALAGTLFAVLAPVPFAGAPRAIGLVVGGVGLLLVVFGLIAPTAEHRATRGRTRLDAISPAWQFREIHGIRVQATPAHVYEAMRQVRADEILFFRALTWLRRGGRSLPPSILHAGSREPLIDVALSGGFVLLANDPPREIVIGMAVLAPERASRHHIARQEDLAPGMAVATMNFLVTADGPTGSRLSTETRVYANSPRARRRFAAYWRLIYPGSALIRRMWLRAIARRAATR